jgi:hypothetical protein
MKRLSAMHQKLFQAIFSIFNHFRVFQNYFRVHFFGIYNYFMVFLVIYNDFRVRLNHFRVKYVTKTGWSSMAAGTI